MSIRDARLRRTRRSTPKYWKEDPPMQYQSSKSSTSWSSSYSAPKIKKVTPSTSYSSSNEPRTTSSTVSSSYIDSSRSSFSVTSSSSKANRDVEVRESEHGQDEYVAMMQPDLRRPVSLCSSFEIFYSPKEIWNTLRGNYSSTPTNSRVPIKARQEQCMLIFRNTQRAIKTTQTLPLM